MDPFHRPFARDTTPHAPREMFARLATVLLAGTALGAPVLALLALSGRDSALLYGAYGCAAVAVALFATRRFWRLASAPSAASIAPAAPAARPAPAAPAADATPAACAAPAPGERPRILLLDASRSGPGGNSSRLLDLLASRLGPRAELRRAALAGPGAGSFATLEGALREADAFVFATGTHWDSWSAVLQRFLEEATPAEASAVWLGKPVAVLVTEHSVGGKAVLSRLQGVFVTLGCSVPPFSGLVVSLAAQLARRHAPATPAAGDFWSPEDLEIVAHNLLAAARAPRPEWRAWPVDRRDFGRPWLEADRAP